MTTKPKPDDEPEAAPTGSSRLNKLPIVQYEPALPNSTLASRAKARAKRVGAAENKAVQASESK